MLSTFILGILICFSTTLRADDGNVSERITDLLNIYGKKAVLSHIIGGDNDNFTIRVNNKPMKSPNPLRGINAALIDVSTIRYDMKRYKMTIDELEKRLTQYDEEQAALEQKKIQERREKREDAKKRYRLRQKRLQEEAALESAFEQAIGKAIEEEADTPEEEEAGEE